MMSITLMSAGGLISEKLSEIDEIKGVYQLNNITDIKKTGKDLPAVYVIYDGSQIEDQRDYQTTILVRTFWLIVIVIRNYDISTSLKGENYRLDIDLLLTKILNKLMGYRLSKDSQPIKLEDLPSPDFAEGLGFFSLRVSTKNLFKKEG